MPTAGAVILTVHPKIAVAFAGFWARALAPLSLEPLAQRVRKVREPLGSCLSHRLRDIYY